MNIQIRAAVPTDALPIAVLYNQGIAERSSTFETKLGVYQKHAKLDGSWLDVVIVERLIAANLT